MQVSPNQACDFCRCCDSFEGDECLKKNGSSGSLMAGRPSVTFGPLRPRPSEPARRATDLLVRLLKAGIYPLAVGKQRSAAPPPVLCARALGRSVWPKQSPADLGAPSKSTAPTATLDAASPSFRAQPNLFPLPTPSRALLFQLL